MKNLILLILSMWLVSFTPPHGKPYTNSVYQVSSALPKITISQATLKAQKDPAKYLQGRFDAAKSNVSTTFILPEGDFNLTSTITADNKTINIIGGGGTPGLKTNFRVYHSGPAFVFTRSTIMSTAIIKNISLTNHLNENNSYSQDGIVLHVPTEMENVIIESFWGDGLVMSGDVTTRPGTDVSHSDIKYLTVRSCKGNGVVISGGDANAILFTRPDIRDNEGVGYWDKSFLGCNVLNGMTHNNKMGNYWVTDVNNRATLIACYSEGGSPYDYFDGSCQVFGGFFATGAVLSHRAVMYAYAPSGISTIYRAPYDIDKLKIFSDGSAATMKPDGTFPTEKDVKKWSEKK